MDVRKRKRGIKASREKLEVAMIAAGFETQSDLARRIAELEGIEKPPKDLVSKVFRELAVSTHNLTRIAIALNVEVHTIYLTQDNNNFNEIADTQAESAIASAQTQEEPETTVDQTTADQTPITASSTSHPKSLRVSKATPKKLLGLVLIVLTILVYNFFFVNDHQESTAQVKALQTPLGKVKILIQSNNQLADLATQINDKLSALDKVTTTLTTSPNNIHLSTFEALDNWQVHAVLKISFTKGKYYQLITANLSSAERSEVVLQSVVPNTHLDITAISMTTQILKNTESFIAGNLIEPNMTSSLPAIEFYLRAKNLLFSSHSATNFQTVLGYLNSATQLDPKFSQAFAESCRAFVRMSWIKEETTLLENAAQNCTTANELKPDDLSTISARAELLSKTGEVKSAIELLQPAVEINSQDADALAIMANLYLMYQNLGDSEDSSNLVETHAKKAIALVPQHWKAYNTLGNLYFSQGQIQAAKDQFEQASKVVKQEVILANLGTLQLCFGELENAKQTYLDIIENYQSNYIGYENLGSVYFLKHNYPEALTNKLIAINKQPDVSIHQVWSGLAEAFLQNGDTDKAWEHYTKALTLIERDELLENASFSDQLHKLYYQQKLTYLYPNQHNTKNLTQRVNEFIAKRNNLSLKARSHLAWLAGEANQLANKTLIWEEITKVCKVYENSPELLAPNSI